MIPESMNSRYWSKSIVCCTSEGIWSCITLHWEYHYWSESNGAKPSSLRTVFIDALEDGGSPNPDFRGDKLLLRIKNDKQFEDRIKCSKESSGNQGCISFWLLYQANITASDAMAMAYKLANTDIIKDAGLRIRTLIKRAFKVLSCPGLPLHMTCHQMMVSSQLSANSYSVLSL